MWPTSRRRFSFLSTMAGLAVIAVVWFLVAPRQFGGRNTFVITSGISMEPLIHKGDLVIAREADDYQIGDVVAYKAGKRTIFLHRIVGRDGDRLVMKGDNNTWLDATHPLPSDVQGKMWVHLPAFGKALQAAGKPQYLAVLMFLTGIMTTRKSINKKSTAARGGGRSSGGGLSAPGGVSLDQWLGIALLALVLSVVLAVIAFRSSSERTRLASVTYDQNGAFSYSADVPAGVYNGTKLTTGQPIFLRLASALTATLDYHFSTNAPHAVGGTYSLAAEVGADNGWSRRVEIVPETSFSGDSATITGTADLTAPQVLIALVEEQTGVQATAYTFTFLPTVKLDGTIEGERFQDQFAPKLVFRMDKGQLVLDRPNSPDAGDPLKPSASGLVKRPQQETNSFSVLGMDIPVPLVRTLSLLGIVLSLASAAYCAWALLPAFRGDELYRIRARYAPLLIEVAEGQAVPSERVVDVAHFDDLAKLATRGGRLILHRNGAADHEFLLSEGDVTYRYMSAGDAVPPAGDVEV